LSYLKRLLLRYVNLASVDQHPLFFIIIPQTLTNVLNSHARMVEIVQIKWMIFSVIVSPDMEAKTVLSVRNITLLLTSWSFHNAFFLLVCLLFFFLCDCCRCHCFYKFCETFFFTSSSVHSLTNLYFSSL